METTENNNNASFNMAIKYLERLHDLLNKANFHSSSEEYYQWYQMLLTIYQELYPRLKISQQKEYTYLLLNLKIQMEKQKRKQYSLKTKLWIPTPSIDQLYEFDRLLRKHMNQNGLLMPTKKSIDDTMDEGSKG